MECDVGSIVWVRRRNGSWWPGQILDPDDLSASHLNLPRSGTPVKLLGREDASVDWYNLEKSKRVKAFRCGEFDDCIERVESTHGMPLKKREKYARREDAILHALELEKQILKEQGNLGIASRLSNNVKKCIVTAPETLRNDNEKHANSKSFVLYENEITGGLLPSHIAHDGNKLLEELDHPEETPQMRGLQDSGLTIAPLKGKLSSPVDPNISHKLIANDGAQAVASGAVWTGSALHTDGAGQVGIACRAKRSRYVYLPAESSDSLDYRDTLTCVDMSSSQIGGECPYRGSMVGETKSAFMDDAESDSTETDSTGFDSDSSETEADMDEEMTTLSEPDGDAEEHESTSSDEHDEQAISSNMPYLYPRELVTRGEAVSKWQLKGKRNNRNLIKRSVGAPDRKGIIYGAEADNEGRSHHLSHKRMSSSLHCYRNDFGDALDDDDQMFGLEDEYSLNSGAVSKSRNRIHVDWDDWAWDDHLPSRGYWDIKGSTPTYDDHYRFGGRMNSMLINVDLKVQAGYRKEPVPFVSLNSKLDEKAILGHPIQVETLKDGSSDILFSAIDDFSNDGIGINGNSVLPPAWSTARRTANFRTPCPRVSASNGADVAAEFPSDQERNFEYKQINSGSSSHKSNLLRKSGFKGHQSSTYKRPFKKVPKKASLSSSQKTRTLSSLSIEHKLSRKPLYDSSCYQTDRLIIKPEISGPTTVACIPVQLVFSRLLEKINRPPLKATSNAALLNIGVERNS